MKNQVVYIPAHFQQQQAQAASAWGKKKAPKMLEGKVDGERLTQDIAKAVAKLNQQGYQVQSITPLTSGQFDYQAIHGSGTLLESGGYGYGYSYTQGVTILATAYAETSKEEMTRPVAQDIQGTQGE